jgi:uncharacterized membrane protein YcaP (DUF421 family)
VGWTDLFGTGHELNVLQMSVRAIVIFIYTLILIRISGRRSFGMGAPFDNVILVLLGAILSRAVVGASPFVPTLASGLVISILHRLFALAAVLSRPMGRFLKGSKILLYQDDKINWRHMKRSLVSQEDLMEEVRLRALVDNLENVKAIYMERNGNISTVKKED